MFRMKAPGLLLLPLLGLIPVSSAAEANYCIAVNGGFGNGGTTFIGKGFALPADGNCTSWSGFAKTASTVILTTTGTGCMSSDGKVLTVSVIDADPSFVGAGVVKADYVRLSRSNTTQPFSSGQDTGYFAGSAKSQACTTALMNLPDTHD